MNNINSPKQKILAYGFLSLLIISLIPLLWLGLYTHPLGDDFHYGEFAKNALVNGTILDAVKEALAGVKLQYNIWQGTYSAIFLMYLPPHIFGDIYYKIYPSFIIIALTTSVFFFSKPIITSYLNSSKENWIIISSLTSLLFVECVPLMGETFYWYNGSIYYTGFFALTLFYFGILLRFYLKPSTSKILLLTLMAIIIAGGNYASLLPCVIIVFLLLFALIIMHKSKSKIIVTIMSLLAFLLGLSISIFAPGNKERAATTIGATPIKAIIKSLFQGVNYIKGWSNVWLLITLIVLTPLFIDIIHNTHCSYKHPLVAVTLGFGIFSSASCAAFYGQNNGGAARLFDICWYMMVLYVLFAYYYVLGWILSSRKSAVIIFITTFSIFVACSFFRPISDTFFTPNSIKASISICSGDASYYEEQYKNRLYIINSSNDDLIFAPYDVPESLMYVLHLGDLSTEADDANNIAFASFYGKKSVYIQDNNYLK